MVLTAHESWLKQVIRARTGEPQAVEDLFQQLALIAAARGDSIKEIVQLVPWFHRIAVILSARHRRSMGRMRSKIAKATQRTRRQPPVPVWRSCSTGNGIHWHAKASNRLSP